MKQFHQIIFFFAIIIYGITAYKSRGYYHADEHYQIIEFAGVKLGTHSPNELALEYKAQIRSTIQPTICYAVLTALNFMGIQNPYTQVFILQLLTMAFALFSIRFFVHIFLPKINPDYQKLFILLSYFLWFLPVINIRFTSETWSGLLFLLAIALVEKHKNSSVKKYGLIGIILGFSFLFRYQSAFLAFGFIAWLIFIFKENIQNIFKLILGTFSVIILGILIDTWFYNEITVTSWKYFYVNLVEGAASSFGISPWYFYIQKIITDASVPIGIIIFISLLYFMIRYPRHILTWSMVPFILVHQFIPHKELRFLFPLVNLLPLIFVLSVQGIPFLFKKNLFVKILKKVFLVFFITVNMIGLIAMMSKTAGDGKTKIMHFIYQKYQQKPVKLIYVSWANPYNPWQSVPTKFYQQKNITEFNIESLCDLEKQMMATDSVTLLVCRKINLEDENCQQKITDLYFSLVEQGIPDWLLKINRKLYRADDKDVLFLYEKIKD